MRKLFALVVALTVLSTPALAYEGRFSDDDGSVHEADIETIAALGITKGCGPVEFCPEDLVTRGQMAAFMRRTSFPLDTTLPDAFPDIADSVFRHEINTLADWRVVTGVGVSNNFYPEWPLSRIEMVRWMWRAGWCGSTIANIEVFTDVTLDDPVLAADVPYVWACHRTGMVRGHQGQMFPSEGVTREQMASFIVRYVRTRGN